MKDIYIIIVLYKTELQEAVSYKTLVRPNGITEFFVYDNSPEDFEASVREYPPQATYVRDTANGGLSKAYNRGAREAERLGYRRVLLLDQDTAFAPGAWEAYRGSLGYAGIVAPLLRTTEGKPFSPVRVSGFSPRAVSLAGNREYSLFRYAVVNSGCCVPVELFKRAGGYDEEVRLDFADFRFQAKVRKHSVSFLLLDTEAVQDFSNDTTDEGKLEARFALFLDSARHFRTDGAAESLKHFTTVLKHTLALALRRRKMTYIKLFWREYGSLKLFRRETGKRAE